MYPSNPEKCQCGKEIEYHESEFSENGDCIYMKWKCECGEEEADCYDLDLAYRLIKKG